MILADLLHFPKVVALTEAPQHDIFIDDAFTSDLLSDVMANAPDNSVLITLQAHKNTVACASLAGVKVILLAGHSTAPTDMLAAAVQEGLVILASPENQFRLSVRVGKLLATEQ